MQGAKAWDLAHALAFGMLPHACLPTSDLNVTFTEPAAPIGDGVGRGLDRREA